jgi:hypothetical protein
MSIQFKISITKDIIDRAKHCGTENDIYQMGRNCAIALALKDIFPEVYVTNYLIFPFGIDANDEKDVKIPLPTIAQQFIKLFDGFHLTPNLRLLLPEFEFVIDIPAEVINAINIDEIKELISNREKVAVSHLLFKDI